MNNTMIGTVGSLPLDAAIYSTHAKWIAGNVPEIGAEMRFADGSCFRFVSTAVDLAAGQLVAMNTFNATPVDDKCTAAAIGSYQVEVDTRAVAMFGGSAGIIAANRLSGGYLVINDDTGEGYRYRILSNTEGTASAKVTLTLAEPLKVALDTTSDVIITGSVYDSVVLGTAALCPLGVAMVPSTAATNSRTEYLWIQTAGVASVRITTGTSVAIGVNVVADATGGIKIAGAVTDPLVGVALATDTTATGKIPVMLRLQGCC